MSFVERRPAERMPARMFRVGDQVNMKKNKIWVLAVIEKAQFDAQKSTWTYDIRDPSTGRITRGVEEKDLDDAD